jgi:hypothetical protein
VHSKLLTNPICLACFTHVFALMYAFHYVLTVPSQTAAADAVVAGLAADNLVVALYFAFLFYKAQAGPDTSADAAATAAKKLPNSSSSSNSSSPNGSSSSSSSSSSADGGNALLSKDSLAYSLTLACALTAAGTALAEGLLKGRISAIPITTLLTVAGASLRPQVCHTLYDTCRLVAY